MTAQQSAWKSRGGIRRLGAALRYSLKGLGAAVRHEAAFRQELALFIVLCPLAVWVARSPFECIVLIGPMVMVLIVELLNSALEALADAISLDEHPWLGRAKDLGSAAVLLALLLSGAVWLVVLGDIYGNAAP